MEERRAVLNWLLWLLHFFRQASWSFFLFVFGVGAAGGAGAGGRGCRELWVTLSALARCQRVRGKHI